MKKRLVIVLVVIGLISPPRYGQTKSLIGFNGTDWVKWSYLMKQTYLIGYIAAKRISIVTLFLFINDVLKEFGLEGDALIETASLIRETKSYKKAELQLTLSEIVNDWITKLDVYFQDPIKLDYTISYAIDWLHMKFLGLE